MILKDHGTDIDISDKVIVLEYEDGSPQNIRITLNCKNGRFITKTPIIQQWDRIYVEITPNTGDVIKDVFPCHYTGEITTPGQDRAVYSALSASILEPLESYYFRTCKEVLWIQRSKSGSIYSKRESRQ